MKGNLRSQLQIPALMVAGLLGQFGNDTRPKSFERGRDVAGYRGGKSGRKNKIGIAKDRRNRHRTGDGHTHRRSFILGRPATRGV